MKSKCHLIHTGDQQTLPQMTYFSLVLETLEFIFTGEPFACQQNPLLFFNVIPRPFNRKNII